MALTKIPSELSSTTGIVDNSNATAITIDSNEKVGIGTTSPSDTLSVNGQIGFFGNDGQLKFNDGSAIKGGNNYGDIRIQTDRFRVYNEAGSNLAMNIDSSGNVGIGTSSPSSQLEVQDANGVSLKFGDLASYPNNVVPCFIGTATSALAGINGDLVLCPRTSDAGNILFATGSGQAAERMRIDAAGRVTTPSQPHIDCHGSSSTPYTYSAGDVISHFSNRSTPVGITRNGGRFTVPVAGRYLLTATLYSYLTGLTHARFNLTRNGTVIGLAQIERAAKLDSQADETVYLHHIVHLAANDYIEIKHHGGGQMYRGYTHNSLQMMLIG